MITSSTICFNLRNAWHSISRMYQSHASENEITLPLAYVLLNLRKDHYLPSTQIASMLGTEASSITRTIKSLEEQKLIEKKSSSTDKRQVLICLTELGEKKRKLARKVVNSFNNKIRKEVGEQELMGFLKTLNRINEITSENYYFET